MQTCRSGTVWNAVPGWRTSRLARHAGKGTQAATHSQLFDAAMQAVSAQNSCPCVQCIDMNTRLEGAWRAAQLTCCGLLPDRHLLAAAAAAAEVA